VVLSALYYGVDVWRASVVCSFVIGDEWIDGISDAGMSREYCVKMPSGFIQAFSLSGGASFTPRVVEIEWATGAFEMRFQFLDGFLKEGICI